MAANKRCRKPIFQVGDVVVFCWLREGHEGPCLPFEEVGATAEERRRNQTARAG